MREDGPDGSTRRAEVIARIRAETGIDEAMIHRLVHGFYARVRSDALLGPVFAERIADWDPHLERMCEFWSSVTLATGRYHGQPMQKHLPLPVDARHFDRWLELFRETARETCTPQAAELVIGRAELIARSLETGIATSRGILLGRNERYRTTAPA